MIFNNIVLKDLGIVVQSCSGVLDMPKRSGDIFYDWGSDFEPLVSVDDIYFGTREISVDAFFDERAGVTFEEVFNTLSAITTTEALVTDYGTYQVNLDKINIAKNYKGGKTIKISFIELNPDLSGGMPTVTGSSSVRIDGYDLFVHFGLLVETVKLYEIPALKSSKETVFKNNAISLFRKEQELNVKVNGIYASKQEMTSKINALNALLAKDGFRHFVYKNDGFQCYISDGYKVTIKKNLVEINLKLIVSAMYNIDEIVALVVDQVTIAANPQSDLSIADAGDPAYIKGQSTFVAQDSNKLGGNLPAFFAQESEIKELRDYDASTALETATNF